MQRHTLVAERLLGRERRNVIRVPSPEETTMTFQRYSVSLSALTVLLCACGTKNTPPEPEAKSVTSTAERVRLTATKAAEITPTKKRRSCARSLRSPSRGAAARRKRRAARCRPKSWVSTIFTARCKRVRGWRIPTVGGAAALAAYLKGSHRRLRRTYDSDHAGDHAAPGLPPPRCCRTSRRFSF